jgi:hypothetical protein
MNPSLELHEPGLFRTTVVAMKQWRIVILWLVLTLIPTALLALPVFSVLSAAFDSSVDVNAWAEHFHIGRFSDLGGLMTASFPFARPIEVVAASSVILLIFLSPFLNAAVIASAQANRSLAFAGLIQGGFTFYGRMLRVTIWSLVPLGIVFAINHGISKLIDHNAEKAILESDIVLQHRLGWLVAFVLLFVVHVSIEAARAQFALDPSRRSAVLAWWRGVRLVKRRAVAALGSYFVIEVVAILVVFVLGILRINIPHAGGLGLALVTLLAEIAVAAIAWMQIARLLVLTQITRETARDRVDAGLGPH